jgi:hypothetical protein
VTVFYLSSLESVAFELPRRCEIFGKVLLTTGNTGARAHISPGVIAPNLQLDDITEFILVPRHEGFGLWPITKFPCFVFVCFDRGAGANKHATTTVVKDDLIILAWCEIYRTEEDARAHRFDP